ncbi:MAG TPA: acyltransferase [Candidatus Binataceae bacterium]|nr:acyltransferase [Candidatus Binataceae bacterium]
MEIHPHPIGGLAERPGSAGEAAGRFYVPELDSLRFFAFFAVFIHHATGPAAMSWQPGVARSLAEAGGLGVDLFFVLSAYLITKLLLREQTAEGKIDVRSFYIRRILRIWPLYYFYIGVAYVLSRLITQLAFAPSYLVLLLVFLGNARMPPYNFVTLLWSVSMEEQFYLLWPLVIRGKSRRGVAMAAVTMLVIASISRFLVIRLGYLNPPMWINTFTRLDPFAVGILVAALRLDEIAELNLVVRMGLVLAGAGAWFFAVHYCDFYTYIPTMIHAMVGYPAVALGSGAFLLASLGAGKAGARFMLNGRLRYLGKISYGLYVYHLLALIFADFVCNRMLGKSVTGQPLWIEWPIAFSTGFLLTVLLAMASYRWLESPFLRLKDRFTLIPSRPV